jgi:hypothetical protein
VTGIRPPLEPFELPDRMLRKACGSFALMRAGELPGDPEVAKPLSHACVFDWYQDCPEQIERAVIIGATVSIELISTNGVNMSTTRVYKVKLYNASTDEPIISRRMATRGGADRMGGSIIEGTAYVIDSTELEPAQGWTPIGFDPVALGYKKAID